MTDPCVWHESFICVTWSIHMCDMDYPYVWHDWSICVPGLIYMWRDLFICEIVYPDVGLCCDALPVVVAVYVTWRIHTCDISHSYVWHDSFICVTWLIHMWHDSFICVTWLFHMWHDSFIRVTYLHVCDLAQGHSYVENYRSLLQNIVSFIGLFCKRDE